MGHLAVRDRRAVLDDQRPAASHRVRIVEVNRRGGLHEPGPRVDGTGRGDRSRGLTGRAEDQDPLVSHRTASIQRRRDAVSIALHQDAASKMSDRPSAVTMLAMPACSKSHVQSRASAVY